MSAPPVDAGLVQFVSVAFCIAVIAYPTDIGALRGHVITKGCAPIRCRRVRPEVSYDSESAVGERQEPEASIVSESSAFRRA